MSVVMTTSQAAVILGVRPETVRRYVRAGNLKATKDTGRLGITVTSLAQFVHEQQLLGKTVFTKDEITSRVLERSARNFALLIVAVATGDVDGLIDQKMLFELAWLILSTRFISEWDGVGKKYRGIVLHCVEGTSGNQMFAGLHLAFQLYELRVKELERIQRTPA